MPLNSARIECCFHFNAVSLNDMFLPFWSLAREKLSTHNTMKMCISDLHDGRVFLRRFPTKDKQAHRPAPSSLFESDE